MLIFIALSIIEYSIVRQELTDIGINYKAV